MEDDNIIELYFQRDEMALSATQERYGAYCRSIAQRIVGNLEDTEECVSDTWLRAWNAIPPQRPRKLSLFLGRITRNLSFDKYKAERTQKRGGGEFALVLEELDACVPTTDSAEQPLLDQELSESINRFLHTLSEQACSIFLRRYWYAAPLKEIAAQFSMHENSVKASLFRSRAKLKLYLEKEGMLP